MYCPKCGKTNSADQRFCRSCGLSLEKIVQSLVEQLPVENQNQDLGERKRKVERWLNIVAGSAISILVLSVFYGIIFKVMIEKGEVVKGAIFLIFIVGIVLFALLAIYRDSLDKASANREDQLPALAKDAGTAKLLPETRIEAVPSVTERTTELLMAEKVRGDEED